MTPQQCIDLAERITYKPDVKIFIGWSPGLDAIDIRFRRMAQDSDHPEINYQHAIASLSQLLPEYIAKWSEEEFLGFIRSKLILFEIHELNEWLRIDGQHLIDPHPELERPKVHKRFKDLNWQELKKLIG